MKNSVFISKMIRITAAIITLGTLSYYLVLTKWNLVEILRFSLGITLLWLPFSSVFYILLKRQVKDRIIRFTFSAIASYTLTTLIYFGLVVLKLELAFYLGQLSIFLGLIIYSIRRKFWLNIQHQARRWWRFDWVLAILISLSLVVNIPYQMPWEYSSKTGAYTFTLAQVHLYYTGQAYELARHIPPQQQSIRSGTPERAYHMFPHLTTMLLSRFTGQTDMLRVSIIYHYIIIEIGMCLVLYSIAKTLTNSRLAGYIATAMMYVLAIPYPPLINKDQEWFYFTLFPHVSSGIEPIILTSPQMYSGMLVAYGVLLGVLLISVRFYRKQPVDVVVIITAIMVAATSRFRVHVFLPLLPGFLLLAGYGWKYSKQKAYLVAASLALVFSVLLYLEMKSPNYLSETANLRLGFNILTTGPDLFISSWPFCSEVYTLISWLIPNLTILEIVWQIISIPVFVVLNMIGIPLLTATSLYLFSKPARQEFLLFSCLIVWLTVVSTLGAICLTTDYDSYSVGGQLLFPTCWYPFLLMVAGIWSAYPFLQHHFHLNKEDAQTRGRDDTEPIASRVTRDTKRHSVRLSKAHKLPLNSGLQFRRGFNPSLNRFPASFLLASERLFLNNSMFLSGIIALIVWSLVAQHFTTSSLARTAIRADFMSLSANERMALAYIHDTTLQNSVILTDKYILTDNNQQWISFLISGLAGRATYLEAPNGPVDVQSLKINPLDNRGQRLQDLWETSESEQFCKLLTTTSATHLVEFSTHPLGVHNPPCLQQIWVSPHTSTPVLSETVTIWKVH